MSRIDSLDSKVGVPVLASGRSVNMMHDEGLSNAMIKNATLKMTLGNQLRQYLKNFCRNSSIRLLMELAMACRALLFVGNKFVCPCCGWSLRAFTHGGMSVMVRPAGSCPRCNSKARHRRDWLYLKENTNLFVDPVQLLHVSPKYALSRRLANMVNIQFVGVDIIEGPHISHQVDITEIPFGAESFDAIICIHVLEHIENDRKAIAELHRVLRTGGWALITVPIELERETYEDPQIISPDERKKHFGESQHVRVYGFDFSERLKARGFDVLLDRGVHLPVATMERYGLLADENIFYCTKPPVG